MFASRSGYKSAQTRFNLLLLEDGEFFLDVGPPLPSLASLCCLGS
jgi:hypothetical protein